MDPDAPITVLKGFFTTCSAGALVGTAYGIVKKQPPIVPAINTSINSGIAGLSFFALREYVAGPVLVHTMPWQTYVRRRQRLHIEKSNQLAPALSQRTSFSEMRSYKLLDSAVAGAGTGGILNLWRRGPSGIIPGAVTASLICTVAQFIWNELDVIRVQFVSQASKSHMHSAEFPARQRTISEKVMDGLGMVLPVRKIPDDIYLERLLRERQEVEKKLEAVRKALQDAERCDKP